MNTAVTDWSSGNVLVLGDTMLDRYWEGDTKRISPEAPVPVVKVNNERDTLGGAANVAANVVALGSSATLIGCVGDDAAGERVAELCREARVRPCLLVSPRFETMVKLRVMSQHQQLIRLDFEAPATAGDRAGLDRVLADELPRCDVVVLSDYGKGFVQDSAVLVAAARRAGKHVIVDPKSTDFSRYTGASLVTPNLAEFEACVGPCRDDEAIVARALGLCAAHDIEALLVTRGEHGMLLIAPGSKPLVLRSQAREVFDVTGAGDTVCAIIAASLAAGFDIAQAVTYANTGAGIAVGKSGTATVSAAELRGGLAQTSATGRGILTLPALVPIVEAARRDGDRIVLTNGCFDVLHAGHVTYLAQARTLGTRLIVAINGDASVTRLKGLGRPIHRLEDRMAVIAALSIVDWVVSFEDDDPLALIQAINPDVLVKGGDYSVDEIIGGDHVRGSGGDVVVLPFVPGHSTTRIVQELAAAGDVEARSS